MTGYIRAILGNYVPLAGEGIATINIEYIVNAILLIMSIHFMYKIFCSFFYKK